MIRRGAAALAALQAAVPKVLRIGVIQGARIIEERIIRQRETVTVGQSEKNHFVTPDASVPGRFPLFDLRPGAKGDQYFLTMTAEMTGRVAFPAADGGVMDLAAIRASKKALPGPKGTQVALTDDCKGRVVVGDTTMLFQFVVPPPIQPRPQLPASVRGGWIARMDPGFLFSLGASCGLHVAMFCAALIPNWPKPTLDEILASDYSPANIQVVTAGEMVPEEEENDEGEKKPGEGETTATGKETAPTEGATGEATAEVVATTEVKPQGGPQGPRPDRVSIGGESLSQGQIASIGAKVENSLNLENLLGGGGDGPVMGIGAEFGGEGGAVTGLDAALAGAAGTTEGSGGGGYGTVDGNYIQGGPTVGEIGGTPGGEGPGATGPAVVPSHTEVAKVEKAEIKKGKVRPGRTSPVGGSGRMTGSVFTQKLGQKRGAIEACYNNALSRDPTLSGDLTFVVTINLQGSVSVDVEQNNGSLDAAGVTSCIAGRLRSLNFTSSPPEGGDVRVRVPISFIAP